MIINICKNIIIVIITSVAGKGAHVTSQNEYYKWKFVIFGFSCLFWKIGEPADRFTKWMVMHQSLWSLDLRFDFPQIIHSTVYVLELGFRKKGHQSLFSIFLEMTLTKILRKILGARDTPQGLFMEDVENKMTSQCWQSLWQWKLIIPYCFHGKFTFLTKEAVMIYIMMKFLSICVSQKITTFSGSGKARF